MTIYLTLADTLEIHRAVIADSGGSSGVRDVGLLDSAIHRPQASFAKLDLYPSLPEKAAALLHSLTLNHPFVDGNKRTAFTATDIFLRLNGWQFAADEDHLYDFVIAVTEGRLPLPSVIEWIRTHITELT